MLAGLISQARDNYSPPQDDADRAGLPLLFDLISPRLVPDPHHNGPHEPRKVLREPLLMVSWDRGQGRWKWAISDKMLNFSLTGSTERLSGLLESIESQVRAGTVGVRTIKVK